MTEVRNGDDDDDNDDEGGQAGLLGWAESQNADIAVNSLSYQD
jgi:hypothetical protein